jgi:hypothetical protein
MNHPQKIARVFGVLYLITFITSIPAFFFYGPVLNDPRFVLGGGGGDTSVAFGALLELLLIVANIGTAVVPYPIFRRQNEILALGYVTARIVECTFILVGLLSLLTVVTLRQEAAAGADAGSLITAGKALVALHIWTSQLGPGFVVGIGNGLILGYLMYRSELVPRGACWLGLIGGPLIIATGTAILFTGNDPSNALRSLQGIATIPEFLWELFLGLYCTFKGFRPSSPILRDNAREDRALAAPATAPA